MRIIISLASLSPVMLQQWSDRSLYCNPSKSYGGDDCYGGVWEIIETLTGEKVLGLPLVGE